MSSACSATLAPSGPHHFSMMSGTVNASNSFSGGAAITRETVNTRSSLAASAIGVVLLHQALQPVERGVPEMAVRFEPVLDLAKTLGTGAKDAELALDPPLD